MAIYFGLYTCNIVLKNFTQLQDIAMEANGTEEFQHVFDG